MIWICALCFCDKVWHGHECLRPRTKAITMMWECKKNTQRKKNNTSPSFGSSKDVIELNAGIQQIWKILMTLWHSMTHICVTVLCHYIAPGNGLLEMLLKGNHNINTLFPCANCVPIQDKTNNYIFMWNICNIFLLYTWKNDKLINRI